MGNVVFVLNKLTELFQHGFITVLDAHSRAAFVMILCMFMFSAHRQIKERFHAMGPEELSFAWAPALLTWPHDGNILFYCGWKSTSYCRFVFASMKLQNVTLAKFHLWFNYSMRLKKTTASILVLNQHYFLFFYQFMSRMCTYSMLVLLRAARFANKIPTTKFVNTEEWKIVRTIFS